MPKIVLRVAASPLTPAHIAAVYAGKEGSGFGPHDSPSIAAGYYDTVIAALMDSIASDTHFQQGIDGHLWTPLRMQALNRGMLARSRMLSSVRP